MSQKGVSGDTEDLIRYFNNRFIEFYT